MNLERLHTKFCLQPREFWEAVNKFCLHPREFWEAVNKFCLHPCEFWEAVNKSCLHLGEFWEAVNKIIYLCCDFKNTWKFLRFENFPCQYASQKLLSPTIPILIEWWQILSPLVSILTKWWQPQSGFLRSKSEIKWKGEVYVVSPNRNRSGFLLPGPDCRSLKTEFADHQNRNIFGFSVWIYSPEISLSHSFLP